MNFMNMQYDDFITNIIKTRGQWDITADVDYWEGHHIVPKCMGGDGKSRSKDPNIIWLLPEEHFIAHYLLCLKYPFAKNETLSPSFSEAIYLIKSLSSSVVIYLSMFALAYLTLFVSSSM